MGIWESSMEIRIYTVNLAPPYGMAHTVNLVPISQVVDTGSQLMYFGAKQGPAIKASGLF